MTRWIAVLLVVVGVASASSISVSGQSQDGTIVACSTFFGFNSTTRMVFVTGILTSLHELRRAGFTITLRLPKDLGTQYDVWESDLRGACRLYPEAGVTRLVLYLFGVLPPP